MTHALSTEQLCHGVQISITQYRQKLADDDYGAGWTLSEFKESAKSWVDALHERWEEESA